MVTYQVNIEIFLSIEIEDLLANPKVKVNSCDLLDDNQIKILNILEELVFFVL